MQNTLQLVHTNNGIPVLVLSCVEWTWYQVLVV